MTPVIYDVILHNFNKVVKEKYGDKPVKVSELPWRDWWWECGARPVGQNNVAGILTLTLLMYEDSITYDVWPFLDDADGVTEFSILCNGKQSIHALPPMKNANRLNFDFTGSRSPCDANGLTNFINRSTKQGKGKYININAFDVFGDLCLTDDFSGLIVIEELKNYPKSIKAKNATLWFFVSNNFFDKFNINIECQDIIFDGEIIFATKNAKDFIGSIRAKEFRLQSIVIVANGLEDIFQDLNCCQTITLYHPIAGCDVEKLCLDTVASFDLHNFHPEYSISPTLKMAINETTKTYGEHFIIDAKNNIIDALRTRDAMRICGGF